MIKIRHMHKGVSLIELMIAVAVVALLGTVALPSYQSYIARGNRSNAISELANIAQALERHYTFNRAYTADFQVLNMAASSSLTFTGAEGLYSYSIANVAANDQTFNIIAVPSSSFRDPYQISLNQLGRHQHRKGTTGVYTNGLP